MLTTAFHGNYVNGSYVVWLERCLSRVSLFVEGQSVLVKREGGVRAH